MLIQDVIDALEAVAPPHLQESYDNSGLIAGTSTNEVTGILVSLDATPEIVDEAIAKGCNLVVSHHPIVFRGLKSITGKSYVERSIIKAIKNDVALYAIHTNLDNVLVNGVNGKIAERLGLMDLDVLRHHPDHDPGGEIGAGIIGYLHKPMTEQDFLQHLKSPMNAEVVKHTALTGTNVEKIAICGGSGSFLLGDAIRAGADFFVTADFKYHEFFDAEGKVVIADIGHFESEQFTIDLLCDIIRENFPTFAPNSAETNTNPVNYYT